MEVVVVNMIPEALSGETNSDSEPFIAVNPADPQRIAASAFTPDPVPDGSTFPIYVSADGGQTWALHPVVPAFPIPDDITLRFSASTSHLYAAVRKDGLKVSRSSDPDLQAPMSVIHTAQFCDQPYIDAATVPAGPSAGQDRIYIGRGSAGDAPGQSTLAIDLSLDAAAASPAFSSAYPDTRALIAGAYQIRPAIHPDGTIYGLFYSWLGTSAGMWLARVIVVRDDVWGVGYPKPFTTLKDPSDNQPGRFVTPMPITYPDGPPLGQERLGGELAIAVDPRDSRIVYVAWADQQGAGPYTLHVRASTNKGQDWSGDLRTILNAQNPALAVNSRGKIAFLYQQLTDGPGGARWETHLQRSADTVGWQDLLLATMPADAPAGDSLVGTYLGDYLSLMAVGKDFYGIFSMSNLPDFENYLDNFPQGVAYQRKKDFDSQPHTLLDVDGATPVMSSIDPFFVKVTEIEPELDVYVRDWTEDAAHRDNGVEPSAHGDFFTTSDVWNQWTSGTPLPFDDSDQPPHEPPQAAILGDNFAFVRVSRNATNDTPVHVDAQFLYADFGITPFATLPAGGQPASIDLGPNDPVQTLSVGYKWQLPDSASPHVAMAVQISAEDDPMVTPGLQGKLPGTSTDTMVRLDNNKALRDAAVYEVIPGITQVFYAAAYCPPPAPCDPRLFFDLAGPVEEALARDGYIELIDGRHEPVRHPFRGDQVLRLERMRPGEYRWIGITMMAATEPLKATFTALQGDLPTGGFTVVAQPSSLALVLQSILRFHAASFSRVEALQIAGAAEESRASADFLRAGEVEEADYLAYIRAHADAMRQQLNQLLESAQSPLTRTPRHRPDPFGVSAALTRFQSVVRSGNLKQVAGEHSRLLHALDAFLTMVFKFQGEVPQKEPKS
jgi:hypothetical protein